jgi:inosine-uridine nucleoside N-ribohydrolase
VGHGRRATALRASALAFAALGAACAGGDDGAEPSQAGATEATAARESTATTTATDVTEMTAASVVTAADTTATSATAVAGGATHPLVVDTDLSSDDLIAILLLLADQRVDVRGITVSGTGEVTCPRGATVARGLLAAVDRSDVPVACGRTTPLAGDHVFPDEWRVAADNASGLLLEDVPAPPDEQDAVTLMTDAIEGSAIPATVLTLGPLTNVAEAFAATPALVGDVAGVVVMGGAVGVPGNVQPDGAPEPLPVEWNLYIDPAAAAAVVSSGAPVTLVGLDATNAVPVRPDLVHVVAANEGRKEATYVRQVLELRAPPYLWDTLAATAVTDPDVVPRHAATIAVVTEGGDAGRTVERGDGASILVADPPDADTVVEHLVRTVGGVPAGEALAAPEVVADMTVSFDGTNCVYAGPESVPAGLARVIVPSAAAPPLVIVAHLVGGATVDDALAWVRTHADEEPPMVDDVTLIGEGGLASPALVELSEGTVGLVCGLAPDDLRRGAELHVTG